MLARFVGLALLDRDVDVERALVVRVKAGVIVLKVRSVATLIA
jgi:hypothetical protein